ncbi:hypothetical protein HDU87_006880 [Geranomyces variabilis]|uniref:UDP-galactose transporter n=1 Tax=Geranomyces variabilis TaxID=109894 RepID=A0AAD5THE1_9FUNG|nr:hypothetical protein HDU87_006880 [Geranomyces variabilis]
MLGLVQNALTYIALTGLPVAWYQAASQAKVITTAIFAIVILRRKPSGRQMLALFILVLGALTAQYYSCYELPSAASAPRALAAVLAASTLSGFTCVYHEKVSCVSRVSVCIRNAQLGFLSAAAALLISVGIIHACNNGPAPRFLAGFDRWIWSSIVLQATSGLLVAHMLKSAGAIVKNFAASLSIPLTTLLSGIVLNTSLHGQVAIGMALLLFATWMYTTSPPSFKCHNQATVRKLDIPNTAPQNP